MSENRTEPLVVGAHICIMSTDRQLALLDHDHLSRRRKIPCIQPVEIDPAGDRFAVLNASIPIRRTLLREVRTGGLGAKVELPNQRAAGIVDGDGNESIGGEPIGNPCL